MNNLQPNNNDSGDSFEKTEDLINRSLNPDPEEEEGKNQTDQNSQKESEEVIDLETMKEMVQEGKFNTFKAPEKQGLQDETDAKNPENLQVDSLKNCIDQLGNLEPTESEKQVKISEKYDIDLVPKENTGNSRYANFDSNIPDEEEERDRVTDLNDVTRFGNKSLFGNVRFTESVNMRIDDYKRTSNYQKLIEEELLKDQMAVPGLPQSVINPKKKEIEVKSKEEIGDVEMGKKEEEEEGEKKRHLTMIRKARDTDMNFENNLTIMELAKDIGSEFINEQVLPENNENPIFKNDNIEKQVSNVEPTEKIEEEQNEESHSQKLEVTNLETNENEEESQNWNKKQNEESNVFEEVEEIPLPENETQKQSSEVIESKRSVENEQKTEIQQEEKSKNN